MFYRKKEMNKTLTEMGMNEGGVVKRLLGNDETLRELRDLGIVVDAQVNRVWEKPGRGCSPVCLQVGDRRVSLNDLLAGSVEVAVPRVCTDTGPGAEIERWRVRYLLKSL